MSRLNLHSILLVLCFLSTVGAIIPTLDKIGSSILQVLGNRPNAASFAGFARKYGKKYESIEEIKHRFSIFSDNLELIRSTNNKNLSYTLDINEYVDWSWEDIKQRRMGLNFPNDYSPNVTSKYTPTDEILPVSKDWRTEGMVTPVRDQGNCNACWAFCANAALESAFIQSYKREIDLSEQQLVDCSRGFHNFGCKGGLMDRAYQYAIDAGGIETEQSYPYAKSDGNCRYSPANVGLAVREYVTFGFGDEYAMKHTVAYVRPVSVGFTANPDFGFYKGGIYNRSPCGTKLQDLTHALLLVGYGVENGVPYWIAKNSWGVQWGEQGYAKILMGQNKCGIATAASYPVIW